MSWTCWNCGEENSLEGLDTCVMCGAGKNGSPPDPEMVAENAAINAAADQIGEKLEKRKQIVDAINNVMSYYGREKIVASRHNYNNDQLIRNHKYKLKVFAKDDPRIIDELKRILNIKDSFVTLMQNEQEEKFEVYYLANESKCFIATAAYGSPLAPEVIILSRFRDNILLSSSLGKLFVKFYYHVSPPLAEFIAKNSLLRIATRYFFLAPVVRLLKSISRLEQ